MKKWILSLTASLIICISGLIIFVNQMAEKACIDSGGSWMGTFKNCEGGSDFSVSPLTSPLAVAIFIGIILGVASAIIQSFTILFSPNKK